MKASPVEYKWKWIKASPIEYQWTKYNKYLYLDNKMK